MSDEWDSLFWGVPQPTSDHSPILLEEGFVGLERPSLLKEERFLAIVKNHWSNFEFKGFGSYIILEKVKALNSEIKNSNKEVFRRVNSNKLEALNKFKGWESIEA